MKFFSRINPITILSAALASFFFVIAVTHTAMAEPSFTCQYSGQNGGNQWTTEEGTYTGTLEYRDGNCIMMKPTEKGPIQVNGKCADATQVPHDDGYCWKYGEEVTNQKPTYIDGSEVPLETWQAMCAQDRHKGQFEDGTLDYDQDNHRCSEKGPFGCHGDKTSVYNNIGGVCTTIDDPAKGLALEDTYGDEKKQQKVQECTDAGATFNGQTHECDWTPATCQAKNGGQGHWDQTDNTCKSFSDYTNKEDCDKAGGEFKITKGGGDDDANNDVWTCVKPGTNGNDPDNPPGSHVVNPGAQEDFENCGEAQTVLVTCTEQDCGIQGGTFSGTPVIGCVLKFAIQALTVLVGVGAVAGIAWESVQYARAQDNQSIVSNARNRIRDIVIGVIVYVFMIAVIQWLIPGMVIG